MKKNRKKSDGKHFKVLGIGTACLDYLMSVEVFPEENSQVYANRLETQGGGNCANTLVALSRLGVEASIVTRIGVDNIGDQIIDSLESERVDTEFVVCTGDRSPISFVVVGERTRSRTVIHRKGIEYDQPFAFDPTWLDDVDLVYLGGRFDMEVQIATEAKKRGMIVVVEAEHTGTKADRLFGFANVVITSENFHSQYFQNNSFSENLIRINAMGPAVAIATLGPRGAVLSFKNQILKMDAIEAKIVDTTGAGDAFAAGFIYGSLLGLPLDHRLVIAQKLAARNCGFIGARSGLATYEQAKDWFAARS